MKPRRLKSSFAICVKNKGYTASLDLRKIYQIVPDERAAAHQQIRVIDESGEDYLYPKDYFVPVDLPEVAEKVFALAV